MLAPQLVADELALVVEEGEGGRQAPQLPAAVAPPPRPQPGAEQQPDRAEPQVAGQVDGRHAEEQARQEGRELGQQPAAQARLRGARSRGVRGLRGLRGAGSAGLFPEHPAEAVSDAPSDNFAEPLEFRRHEPESARRPIPA